MAQDPTSPTDAQQPALAKRRGFFAGLGAVGAAGVLAGLTTRQSPEVVAEPTAEQAPPAQGGGYQLTAHVKRYYETTRV